MGLLPDEGQQGLQATDPRSSTTPGCPHPSVPGPVCLPISLHHHLGPPWQTAVVCKQILVPWCCLLPSSAPLGLQLSPAQGPPPPRPRAGSPPPSLLDEPCQPTDRLWSVLSQKETFPSTRPHTRHTPVAHSESWLVVPPQHTGEGGRGPGCPRVTESGQPAGPGPLGPPQETRGLAGACVAHMECTLPSAAGSSLQSLGLVRPHVRIRGHS